MTSPTFDKDGYPTDDTLEAITDWPMDDIDGWFAFIEEAWYYPQYFKRDGNMINLSTGGWSGNESIISAMTDNVNWRMTWRVITRGGHYEFELPKRSE
jgi:hypothetical protein